MNVVLVSHDADLYKLCREILSELVGRDGHLVKANPDNCPGDADLYLWDGPAPVDVPQRLAQSHSRHLFLIQRNDVARFNHNMGGAEANILLKPVTRATLSAFLGLTVSAHRDRILTANSLRADRDEILQCLIQTNLKLQEYDHDRTNFLTRAVHDFRAPLTAITGYCGLLLGEALGTLTEDQNEVLGRMQHSAKRLSRMASAMFQLSVGRQIKRPLDLRKGNIRECMEQAVHETTPLADGKNVSIAADLEPEYGTLYFEPGQVEQVLINLLDNACKFTPKGGEIEIMGYPFFWERRAMRISPAPGREQRYQDSPDPNAYRIEIRNSGAPIPVEHLADIFEEYTSYAGGQDRSGGGLGLAICKMIATLHGGRVWAENTESGPMFSFVLPVSLTESGVPEAAQAQLLNYTEA